MSGLQIVEQVGALVTAEGAILLLGRRIFRHSSRIQRIWKLPDQVDALAAGVRSVDAKVDGIRTAFDARLRMDEETIYGRGRRWHGDAR